MRILFMLEDLGLGGVERVTVNLLRHLAPRLQKAGGAADLMVAGPRRDLLSGLPESLQIYPVLSEAERMRRAFPKVQGAARRLGSRYDLIVPTAPHLTAASLMSNSRVLPWVHFDYNGMLESKAIGAFTKMTVKSLYPWRKHAVFAGPGARSAMPTWYNNEGWRFIPNLFDPTGYPSPGGSAAAVRLIKAQGLPVLGFVGRLSREKGLDRLLAAHKHLLRTGLEHNLVVIGNGPERTVLQNQGPRLHLLGADPNPLEAMSLFDATLLTSYMETWPTVAIESLSVGTPVVAYDCPSGPRSILTGDLIAGLATDGNVWDFGKAVEWALLKAPALLERTPQIVTDSSPDNVVQQWLDLFSELTSKP